MARVDLILKAIDQSTNVIGNIDRRLQGLEKTTKRFTADSLVAGSAVAAGFIAINSAVNVATIGIEAFGRALSDAANIQVETTVLAGQLSQLLGKSYEETNDILTDLNKNITEQVDVLPGLTEGYTRLGRQLLDSVIPAATRLDGSLDTQKLIEYTTELSRAYGLLAQTTPGLTTDEVLSTLTKAISGTATIAELSRLDLFQKNPILLRALKEELVRRGVDELKDLDESARVEVLKKIGTLILDDETIARLSNTLLGRVEGFITTLFDPTSGIFGFARQLEARGDRTVLDAVNNALGQLFEVFGEIAKIAQRLGFRDTGILEGIYDFFNWLAQQLQALELLIAKNQDKIVNALQFIRDFLDGDISLSNFLFKVGELIGRGLAQLLARFASDPDNLGVNLFGFGLLEKIGAFLAGILFGIGRGLADLTVKITQDLISNIISQATAIVENIKENGLEILLQYFSEMILNAIPGAGLFESLSEDGQTLADFIRDAIFNLLNAAINAGLGALAPVVPDIPTPGGGDTSGTAKRGLKVSAYGNIPLMNAISTEARLSPGTDPVIANNSEYIFTKDQMSKLMNNNRSTPNITINIQGVLDERIVEQIKRAINSEWKNYKRSYSF